MSIPTIHSHSSPAVVLDKETEHELVQEAIKGRENAFCPYSGYQVGAAVLTREGTIVNGCNVENNAFPSVICAERTALGSAVAKGKTVFEAIAVVTKDGKGFPCGNCLQSLNEFAPKIQILTMNTKGKLLSRTTLPKLLPHAFGPQNL